MHLSDALLSPPVAITAGAVAMSLIAVSANKIKKIDRPDLIPLMGVMGAFVFAAQMINFTIPGTGSSGHLIGGILLAAILGPWAAFIALSSILIVQCLVFADGGLMALGCNIINMAAFSCLVAYPLVYRPIVGKSLNKAKILIASTVASIVALELGAFAVTAETELSGITALPFTTFLKFMMPIHMAIGLVEGIVTGLLLAFIASYRPAILNTALYEGEVSQKKLKSLIMIFGLITLVLASGFTILASEYPDGLEWSVEKVAGDLSMDSTIPVTAVMPDYDSGFAGIIGVAIVMVFLWGISTLIFSQLRKYKARSRK